MISSADGIDVELTTVCLPDPARGIPTACRAIIFTVDGMGPFSFEGDAALLTDEYVRRRLREEARQIRTLMGTQQG